MAIVLSENNNKDLDNQHTIPLDNLKITDDLVDAVLKDIENNNEHFYNDTVDFDKANIASAKVATASKSLDEDSPSEFKVISIDKTAESDTASDFSVDIEDDKVTCENNSTFETIDVEAFDTGELAVEELDKPKHTKSNRKFIDFRNNRNRSIVIVCIAVLLIAGIALGAYAVSDYREYVHMMESTINIDTFYDGIYIDDVNVSGLTLDQATAKVKETEASLRPDIDITITCAGQDYVMTQDNLTFTYNTDEVVNQAYESGRTGSTQNRYDYVESIKTTPDKFYVTCSLDPNNCSLDTYVSQLAEEVHKDPIKPHVGTFDPNSENMFTYDSGSSGQNLVTDDLISTLTTTLSNKSYQVNVPANTTSIPIPDTSGEPSLDQQTVLVSSFSTVSTNNSNANSNMATALAAINGTTVNPGEVFSFNKATGDSSNPNNGYLPAGAIINGELEDLYGGGICQVSTTLYGAAMRADMEILTRSPHEWPSSYVPIGQDAMVSYGSSDFRFKNTSDYPIFIKSYMSGTTLTVELYGYHPTSWDSIDVVSEGNADSTYATGNKIFYKDGSVVKTEAIYPSTYSKKES